MILNRTVDLDVLSRPGMMGAILFAQPPWLFPRVGNDTTPPQQAFQRFRRPSIQLGHGTVDKVTPRFQRRVGDGGSDHVRRR